MSPHWRSNFRRRRNVLDAYLNPSQDHHSSIQEKQQHPRKMEDDLLLRLRALQTEIPDAKIDYYVVPSEDEHQSEEIGPSDERRKYITGFSGSAGTALVPASSSTPALLFVDSRYWVQAEQQVPKTGWKIVRVGANGGSGPNAVVGGWTSWVIDQAPEGSRIGIDPKLISLSVVKTLQGRLASSSTKLVPLQSNLVDKTYDAPTRSLGPLIPHSIEFSGEDTPSKLNRTRKALSSQTKTDSWIYLLPTLPAIAWLLNYRCLEDIPFCPVAYAYVALTTDECVVFVDERKLVNEELKVLWKAAGIEVRAYGVDKVQEYVKEKTFAIRQRQGEKSQVKVFSPRECSWALSKACEPADIEIIECPVETLKGVKNPTEQQGFRNAYLRDGRAMVRWMAWLDWKTNQEKRPVREWAAAQVLTRFRREEHNFASLAYEDISGSGPNSALPHYAPKPGSDRVIDPEATYVIDSGGQYLDGTIDTTRTLYMGKSPSADIKRAYTRVLQGHIGVATATFPGGSCSMDWFNMLAREPLYKDGLDFGHGLGHGVGTYLAVHEYPGFGNHGIAFQPGHITTVEPGFYKEGEFGVRIESIYICKRVQTMYQFNGDNWLGWERVTQVPIATNLIEWSLMSKEEIRWLNDHNKDVREALLPLLLDERDKQARDWLKRVTKPKTVWPWLGK
ncbi:peptidase M24, structural domain-containing protein [Naematelia encephala]|uniref:Peptidase M24, structural domain-containing protein n=1 Tax=Naematelia encephala TaxID=71784 RepID=A0A1Y2B5C7_9TREE|nr:peptidase M24, structural domain-containing protein [Naematelia encephala]